MTRVWVGTSGWRYPEWRGRFYPPGLAQRRELEYLSRRVGTVEINGTFYSLQRWQSFQNWAAATPEGFLFAVKGSRFITHFRQLLDVRVPLANFLASGLLALGERLGPLLWQLPPRMGFDPDRLAGFLALLPRTTAAAAELATGHDERMRGRAVVDVDADRPLRHALEARHDSFGDPRCAELLRAHGVALVLADSAGTWPVLDQDTAPFRYLRLHGDVRLYAGGYGAAALDAWAARIRPWHDAGRDVYVYFDNDIGARAPFDAIALARRLGPACWG